MNSAEREIHAVQQDRITLWRTNRLTSTMEGDNHADLCNQGCRADRIQVMRAPECANAAGADHRRQALHYPAESMTDNAQSIAAHHYETPEVSELPLFSIGDPLDFLSAAQHRDLRAIQAETYVSASDDFAEGLTLDYGRVI